MTQLLTYEETAHRLGYKNKRTIQRYVMTGAMRAVDVSPPGSGRPAHRIPADELERFIQGRIAEPSPTR